MRGRNNTSAVATTMALLVVLAIATTMCATPAAAGVPEVVKTQVAEMLSKKLGTALRTYSETAAAKALKAADTDLVRLAAQRKKTVTELWDEVLPAVKRGVSAGADNIGTVAVGVRARAAFKVDDLDSLMFSYANRDFSALPASPEELALVKEVRAAFDKASPSRYVQSGDRYVAANGVKATDAATDAVAPKAAAATTATAGAVAGAVKKLSQEELISAAGKELERLRAIARERAKALSVTTPDTMTWGDVVMMRNARADYISRAQRAANEEVKALEALNPTTFNAKLPEYVAPVLRNPAPTPADIAAAKALIDRLPSQLQKEAALLKKLDETRIAAYKWDLDAKTARGNMRGSLSPSTNPLNTLDQNVWSTTGIEAELRTLREEIATTQRYQLLTPQQLASQRLSLRASSLIDTSSTSLNQIRSSLKRFPVDGQAVLEKRADDVFDFNSEFRYTVKDLVKKYKAAAGDIATTESRVSELVKKMKGEVTDAERETLAKEITEAHAKVKASVATLEPIATRLSKIPPKRR